MHDLFAALCLMFVLEGLFLFAAPGIYRRMVEQLLAMPPAQLRIVGALTLAAGLVALWVVRQVA